jgi:glycosyltransferase involved in cell wall biosynthesis
MNADNLNTAGKTPLHVAMVMRLFSSQGGLELYAYKLVEGLLAKGHKVTVICERNEGSIKHDNLNVVHFPAPDESLPKYKRLQHYFFAASKCVKENGPFDLVHSQHLPMTGADVVTFHNHTTARLYQVGKGWENIVNLYKARFVPAYRLRAEYDRILCTQAACNVFSSQTCRDDFYKTFNLPNTIPSAVAYPGASLSSEQMSLKSNDGSGGSNSKQPFTFLFVGKGFRKKGLDILLLACLKLKSENKQFRLLIAGLRERLMDKLRLKLYGLEGYVTYLGYQKDMASVYAQGQALVLPSRVEPFGMVVVQAMQNGVVPIVSRVCGVSEIIEDGQNGFILEDHLSADKLAEKMTYIIDHSQDLAEFAQKAKTTAQTITWDKTVDDTLIAYNLALAKKPIANRSIS